MISRAVDAAEIVRKRFLSGVDVKESESVPRAHDQGRREIKRADDRK